MLQRPFFLQSTCVVTRPDNQQIIHYIKYSNEWDFSHKLLFIENDGIIIFSIWLFLIFLRRALLLKEINMKKKMATAILLFFKKRKYHHNRELSSTSARYIFLKKTPRGLIEETKHPIKPVFSHHFNSFRAVFSSSSDSFFIHSRALWEQWFFESLCTYCFMSDDKITPSCNYFLCLREIY